MTIRKEIDMEYKTCGHLCGVDVYMPIGDEVIIGKNSFFETYSKDGMKLVDSRIDYMGIPMFLVDKGCQYIVELNPIRRIKVRDRKTKEECCSFGELIPGFVPYRGCFSLDNKSFFSVLTRPGYEIVPQFFLDDVKNAYDFVLAEFSLPDLKLLRIIESEGVKFTDIKKVDFLNSYFLETGERTYMLLDDNNQLTNVTFPCYTDVEEKIFINNYRGEFYTKTPHGIKVLDEHFDEKDSIILFDNSKVKVDSIYFTSAPGGRNDRYSRTDLTSFRLYISNLKPMNEDIIIYTINDIGLSTTTLMAYSFSEKKSYKLLDIATYIETFKVYGNIVVFSERKNIHVIEVKNG